MPSDVAWRFFVASAEFQEGKHTSRRSMKKPAAKKQSQSKKKTATGKQGAVAKSKAKSFKKPSAKATVTKKKKAEKTPAPPRTPPRRTKTGDGVTPWREHFPQ
eukprot:s2495_g10.t1